MSKFYCCSHARFSLATQLCIWVQESLRAVQSSAEVQIGSHCCVRRMQGRLGNRQEQCEGLLAQGQPLQVWSALAFCSILHVLQHCLGA